MIDGRIPLARLAPSCHTGTMTYATTYRVQYPAHDGWTLTTTVDFPTLALLLGSPTEALNLIFRGPGAMQWDLKLLACDTYGDHAPLR